MSIGRRLGIGISGCLAVAAAITMTSGSSGRTSDQILRASAALEDKPIALGSVANYHCHDAAWPVIHCFHTSAARDRDLEEESMAAPSVNEYVSIYSDENYGGSSFSANQPYPNLGPYGWNDIITSFKSRNGGHPKFYSDADYGLPSWQWTAGAWVANVGSTANDRFSSFKNVP